MIHQALKMMRLKNGLTQQQVANLLNIDRSTYTYYETGKIKPDVETLMKLCCVFDVSLDALTKNIVDNNDSLREAVEEYLHSGGDFQSFSDLKPQEKRVVKLFRLCKNKEDVLNKLMDLALDIEDDDLRAREKEKQQPEKE
jgi:transcriptional regulator with XRE-family HTH domain